MPYSDGTQPFTGSRPSNDHLQAIGLAIHEWNMVHVTLGLAVCCLVARRGDVHEDDTVPLVLTTGMSSQTLIGILKTLARMRFPEDADQFDKLADKLRKANGQRDVYAHAVWIAGPKPGTIEPMLAKTVGSLRRAKGAVTADQIRGQATHFQRLALNVLAYLWKWDLAPSPWLERLGPRDRA